MSDIAIPGSRRPGDCRFSTDGKNANADQRSSGEPPKVAL
jgi:hypothetical protein